MRIARAPRSAWPPRRVSPRAAGSFEGHLPHPYPVPEGIGRNLWYEWETVRKTGGTQMTRTLARVVLGAVLSLALSLVNVPQASADIKVGVDVLCNPASPPGAGRVVVAWMSSDGASHFPI